MCLHMTNSTIHILSSKDKTALEIRSFVGSQKVLNIGQKILLSQSLDEKTCLFSFQNGETQTVPYVLLCPGFFIVFRFAKYI